MTPDLESASKNEQNGVLFWFGGDKISSGLFLTGCGCLLNFQTLETSTLGLTFNRTVSSKWRPKRHPMLEFDTVETLTQML